MPSLLFAGAQDASFWDFKGSRASEGVHGIARYPAVMVPEMQKVLLSELVHANPHYQSMLDPFHGSGVTLVEGQDLGLKVTGIDINPYAHLMTKVKLNYIPHERILSSNDAITRRLKSDFEYPNHTFARIDKWFRGDVIASLSKIRHAITLEEDSKIRLFYWLCFGEIVKRHSNTRSSTFKLHIKTKDKIDTMPNLAIEEFLKHINSYAGCFERHRECDLYCGDAMDMMKEMPSSSFDIVCTSPPYGDNATTVTYGQFSVLQLFWMDLDDIGCASNVLESYARLDGVSMGGGQRHIVFNHATSAFRDFISKIARDKQRKAHAFMADFAEALAEMERLLKPRGSLLLTVANRRIDNEEYPLVETACELAKAMGLHHAGSAMRNIPYKRMPRKVSHVKNHGAVKSMSKEVVLLFKKN